MIKKLLFALGVMAVTGLTLYHMRSAAKDGELRGQFTAYMSKHGKSYESSHEMEYRFTVFQESLKRIEAVNSDPTKKHRAGLNQFSDMTFEEFKNKVLMKPMGSADMTLTEELNPVRAVPQIDWRNSAGAVQPVKNQNPCGSCWAFSATASYEFEVWNKTQKSVSYSEGELTDCAYGKHLKNCNRGGFPHQALSYIVKNGLATEQAYPFTPVNRDCIDANLRKPGRGNLSSYRMIDSGVNSLIDAAEEHVVSIGFEVSEGFRDYKDGVYESPSPFCGYRLNHAMAVVGYDLRGDDKYFIVRNSWGASWGEQGYIRVAVGSGPGTCGIAGSDLNTYPTL